MHSIYLTWSLLNRLLNGLLKLVGISNFALRSVVCFWIGWVSLIKNSVMKIMNKIILDSSFFSSSISILWFLSVCRSVYYADTPSFVLLSRENVYRFWQRFKNMPKVPPLPVQMTGIPLVHNTDVCYKITIHNTLCSLSSFNLYILCTM